MRDRAWRRAQRGRKIINRRREVQAIVGYDIAAKLADHQASGYLRCPDGRACPFCHKPFDRAAADREARAEIDEGQE